MSTLRGTSRHPLERTAIERPVSRRVALTAGALGLVGIGTLSLGTGSARADVVFQLPFPAGEVWQGETRQNHNPLNSVDFNADGEDLGRTVVASAGGTVTKAADVGAGSYGNCVVVDHGDGWSTLYAHLQSMSVSPGQQVAGGDEVGKLGSTGNSTGPHLHFEQRKDGEPVRCTFNGEPALYWGSQTYVSANGGGGTPPAPPAETSPGTVDTQIPLTVRSGPGTGFEALGTLEPGTAVAVECHQNGEEITGTFGTSTLWDRIGDGRWVPDVYVKTGSDGPVQEFCA